MEIKWSHLLAVSLFIQPACCQAKWKQISESPFEINTQPVNDIFNNGPRQLNYSPDGSFLAIANALDSFGTGTPSGSISIFSVNKLTGTLTELNTSPFKANTNNRTISLSFSPTESPILACTDRNGSIKFFDFNPSTGNLSNLQSANDGLCIMPSDGTIVTYSPDGKHLASNSLDNSIYIYNVNQSTGDLTCQQKISDPVIITRPRSLTYYPLPLNPSYLAVSNTDAPNNNDVVIFTVNPDTGFISNPKAFKLRAGSQDLESRWISFSPNGKFIAIAVIDGVEMRRFRATGINAPTLLPLNNPTSFFPTPTDQDPGVRSLDHFSPDGRFLAVANGNDTISVFCVDQKTGALFNRQDLVVGHTGNLGTSDLTISVDFSPDGRFLAVCNRDDNSVSVFTNPGAGCPTCQTMINLSNNSSCAACTSTVN